MAVILGQTGNGVNSANSNGAGVIFAQRYPALADATIDTIKVRSGGAVPTAANAHYAIYADAAGPVPGARLTADFNGTTIAVNATTSLPVSPGLVVTLGAFFWIALVGLTSGWDYTNFADTGGTEKDRSGQTGMPDPFGSPTGTNANVANVWAEGVLSGVVSNLDSRIPRLTRVG